MKAMRKILPALILSLTILVGCNRQSPVTQYIAIFDEIAAEIDRASTTEEVRTVMTAQQSQWNERVEQLVQANGDYKLTDDDRRMLKDSMKRYMQSVTKKSLELDGQKPEGIEETVNSMLETFIYPSIDAATTLGDLSKANPKY